MCACEKVIKLECNFVQMIASLTLVLWSRKEFEKLEQLFSWPTNRRKFEKNQLLLSKQVLVGIVSINVKLSLTSKFKWHIPRSCFPQKWWKRKLYVIENWNFFSNRRFWFNAKSFIMALFQYEISLL